MTTANEMLARLDAMEAEWVRIDDENGFEEGLLAMGGDAPALLCALRDVLAGAARDEARADEYALSALGWDVKGAVFTGIKQDQSRHERAARVVVRAVADGLDPAMRVQHPRRGVPKVCPHCQAPVTRWRTDPYNDHSEYVTCDNGQCPFIIKQRDKKGVNA